MRPTERGTVEEATRDAIALESWASDLEATRDELCHVAPLSTAWNARIDLLRRAVAALSSRGDAGETVQRHSADMHDPYDGPAGPGYRLNLAAVGETVDVEDPMIEFNRLADNYGRSECRTGEISDGEEYDAEFERCEKARLALNAFFRSHLTVDVEGLIAELQSVVRHPAQLDDDESMDQAIARVIRHFLSPRATEPPDKLDALLEHLRPTSQGAERADK